jgi:hypothetical protein
MTPRTRFAWQGAASASNAPTVHKPDVAASDRAVELALRGSRLFRVVDAAGAGVRRAWPHARTRTWLLRFALDWSLLIAPMRVRATGIVVAAAGLTAMLADLASPSLAGRLVWVLPAAVAAVGLLASIAAGPLARAIRDKIS